MSLNQLVKKNFKESKISKTLINIWNHLTKNKQRMNEALAS